MERQLERSGALDVIGTRWAACVRVRGGAGNASNRFGYVMEAGRVVLYGAARDLLHDDHVRAAYLGG